jgi:hypothetical protein
MLIMYEVTFVSHALCDYLRPIAGNSEVRAMDLDNQAGEWLCAIEWGLAICDELNIPLPPLFVEKILNLELSSVDAANIRELLSRLPQWLPLAS